MTDIDHAHTPDDKLLIAAEGVGFATRRRTILEEVDLAVAKGEIVTLIGLNGAGKSTLVRILLGLMQPTAGKTWMRPGLKIGYTPQQMDFDRTLPLDVRGFLRLAGHFTDAELVEALTRVRAEGCFRSEVGTLSGGELHRVMLARALLRQPDLLVLDEPLAGVDVAGEADLYELISQIREETGAGVLLVSHDIHVVMAQADRVVCLNRKVLCSGAPRSVAANPAFRDTFGGHIAETLAVYPHHDHDHDHEHDHPHTDEHGGGHGHE
jgi:zinc transport system ATP-binding protein